MCTLCSKNVYNISEMTKREAETLLIEHGVSACMRLSRRSDGTVITDDCPVGLRKLRNSVQFLSRTAATILGFVVSTGSVFATGNESQLTLDTDNARGAFGNTKTVTAYTEKPAEESQQTQDYIRVIPTGTKVPITLDTTLNSDTSDDGAEFSARSGEDLTIDGSTVVPAGSVIKGKIACRNSSRRWKSLELKFETVTTPDNRQIPLDAHLVSRGGIVHVRRGLKDVAVDISMASAVVSLGGLAFSTGLLGKSTISDHPSSTNTQVRVGSSLPAGPGVLLAKRGQAVDLRAGDELKIELANDLRVPMHQTL
jgi:hypothetical protein